MSLFPNDQAKHLANIDGDILAFAAVDPDRPGILCSGADDGVYAVTVTADNGFGSIDDAILWDVDNVLPLPSMGKTRIRNLLS